MKISIILLEIMDNMIMDALDVRILEALQQDGSLTQEKLAERTSSTPSTCLRRIQSLKKSGHLRKCVYLTDPKKMGRNLKAVLTVATTGHGTKMVDALRVKLQNEPAVNEAYGVTGEMDMVIMCNFTNMEEYQQLCERLFYDDPHVIRYSSLFAVETYKCETAVSVAT